MDKERDNSPLKLVLHSTEEQLDQRVDAVADSPPSRTESTADLIRLEEKLSSAQDKAKQLVTLRLKLADDEEKESREHGNAADAATGESASGDAPGAGSYPPDSLRLGSTQPDTGSSTV